MELENTIISPTEAIPTPEWIAFFFALKHEYEEYVLNALKEKTSLCGYIVALETATDSHKETNGEHFHFVCQMTEKDYHALAQRFIKNFNLKGQAKLGKGRQYGKVKKIENIELMKAYTVKDGNVRTNLTDKELERLKAMSYEKNEKLKIKEELMDFLNKHYHEWYYSDEIDPCNGRQVHFQKISFLIINYFRKTKKENRIPILRATLISYITSFIMYYAHEGTVSDMECHHFITEPHLYI